MIRVASLKDMEILLEMVKEFVNESLWGWTFDEENSREILKNYIENHETAVLVDDGGFATLAFDNEFHKERVGYVSKFYVRPSHRKTDFSRKLMEACSAWFDVHDCQSSFATATANIPSEGKFFENLLAKFNFVPCGKTLVRIK